VSFSSVRLQDFKLNLKIVYFFVRTSRKQIFPKITNPKSTISSLKFPSKINAFPQFYNSTIKEKGIPILEGFGSPRFSSRRRHFWEKFVEENLEPIKFPKRSSLTSTSKNPVKLEKTTVTQNHQKSVIFIPKEKKIS
jgi:hypothetical protein